VDGSGNWPFNTAYAGALPGLRAGQRASRNFRAEDLIAPDPPSTLRLSTSRTTHSGQDNGT